MMIRLPAVVQVSSYIGFGASDRTVVILVLSPSPGFDYSASDIEWPLTLSLPGDVEEQNLPGTKYKITIEREEE